MKRHYIGVDVGGTNVKLGISDQQGHILSRATFETKKYTRRRSQLILALTNAVKQLISQKKFRKCHFSGIGIGLPGLIDPLNGIVKFLPNVPGWKDVPLKKILERSLRLPTWLENDVNMITLGEWQFGAGRGYRNLVCMTLGTGVGGGLILNNQLYRGEGFAAGELGHIPINEKGPACNCGGYACFERYVGNRQLTRRITEIYKKKGLQIQDMYRLAERGDIKARQFWTETAEHIGNAMTGVVNVLNPPLVIIGGGVANNAKFLFPTIKQVIRRRAMRVQAGMVRVVRAQLGDDAGILGAQVLAQQGL